MIMALRVSAVKSRRLRLLQLYICVLLLYATVVYLGVLHVHHEAAAQRRREPPIARASPLGVVRATSCWPAGRFCMIP